MPTYSYKAIDSKGAKISGHMDAPERKQVVQKLRSKKIMPVSIVETDKAGESAVASQAVDFQKVEVVSKPKRKLFNVSSKQKIGLNFLRKLLELLQSGMPLGDSVRLISQRVSDPELKDLATSMWRNLSEGRTLASVIGELPEVFGDSAAFIIEAGEATGNLVPMVERIVNYKEESNEMRSKIFGSLVYPAFISMVAFGVVGFFLFFLLPKIEGMLDKIGGELHWSSQWLLAISDFLIQFGPFIAVGLAVVWGALVQWRKGPRGREVTDYWLLRIPFIGRIFLYSEVFQVSTLMSTLISSGINTTETLRLTEQTIRNSILKAKFSICRHQIQEGISMAIAFKRTRFMPEIATDILMVGENTGNLVHGLKEIGNIHRRELSKFLSILTNVISGGALVFAFGLVAIIAMSIVLAVLNVSNTIAM